MFLLTNTSHTQYKVSNLKFLIIFTQPCEKFNMYFLWFRQSISFYCLGTLPLVSVLLFVVYRALTKHPASSATIERSGMLWEVPYIAAWKVNKQKHWLHWNTESFCTINDTMEIGHIHHVRNLDKLWPKQPTIVLTNH